MTVNEQPGARLAAGLSAMTETFERQAALARARTFLFVPADRPERLAKALASGADAVIVDLEDAVAPAAKAVAREAFRLAFAALDAASRARVVLRVNSATSEWHGEDLELTADLTLQGLGGLMLPKAEGAEALHAVASACPGLPLFPLVETGEGFFGLDAIARAPRVLRLSLGHLDLMADLSMEPSETQEALAPARWALVLASRRAGLAPPIDGVTPAIDDVEQLRRETHRALHFGFGARLCIHPAQVAAVHLAMEPSAAQVEWSARVLAAAAQAVQGAVMVDGKMVDAPVLRLARQLRARSSVLNRL